MHEQSVRQPSGTAMKSETAAKKLGIYHPAAPEEFRVSAITHAELKDLRNNPPEWLVELRQTGPHPRPVVARMLGVSIATLKRNGADKPLTTDEINALLADKPEWLVAAQEQYAEHQKSKRIDEGDDSSVQAND